MVLFHHLLWENFYVLFCFSEQVFNSLYLRMREEGGRWGGGGHPCSYYLSWCIFNSMHTYIVDRWFCLMIIKTGDHETHCKNMKQIKTWSVMTSYTGLKYKIKIFITLLSLTIDSRNKSTKPNKKSYINFEYVFKNVLECMLQDEI